ncbi:hypothetical protein RND61_08480 [Streptomyces sp. TRM76323]|uniref:PKD domain-containing protein n=1 Tax=Streptomyces tamarix TaxID=3078565 RepID=A0ABU3QH97_9ACTN|nr:hypothetical protein [Streptomyces tamarix]MDT9682109.1 hypothetical protein [Streptomyces tamarix]
MRLGTPLPAALAAAALTVLAGAVPAAAAPGARDAAPPPVSHCAPTAPLTQRGAAPTAGPAAGPAVGLCVTVAGAAMTVSAAADCACTVSGTWTARRGDEDGAASGTLGTRADYPGPGTYEVTAAVRVSGTERTPTTPVTGTVTATFTLAAPKPAPMHRIEVAPPAVLAPGKTTTLTYTVERTGGGDDGDGSARFGLIGEPGTGIALASTDVRCVNPLTGRYPATTRSAHALDCAFTDLQPGRPATVTVHVTLPPDTCSTVVSKLGYWTPKGQQVAGAMLNGPTVPCR